MSANNSGCDNIKTLSHLQILRHMKELILKVLPKSRNGFTQLNARGIQKFFIRLADRRKGERYGKSELLKVLPDLIAHNEVAGAKVAGRGA